MNNEDIQAHQKMCRTLKKRFDARPKYDFEKEPAARFLVKKKSHGYNRPLKRGGDRTNLTTTVSMAVAKLVHTEAAIADVSVSTFIEKLLVERYRRVI